MILSRILTKFYPALIILPLYLKITTRNQILLSSFANYYPLSIAMILGSLIAGATPLGGGVVAFPISVLVLAFDPKQGRDFALGIQSIGMSCASYTILTREHSESKQHAILGNGEYTNLLGVSMFFSVLGLIFGLDIVVPSYYVNVMYTTLVASFAVILASLDRVKNETTSSDENCILEDASSLEIDEHRVDHCSDTKSLSASSLQTTSSGEKVKSLLANAIFCTIGGMLSAQVGTGADIMTYFYGCTFYKYFNRQHSRADHELVAISVVVMAVTSIAGTLLRITSLSDGAGGEKSTAVSMDVYQAIVACCPVVIIGAPLGSLCLTEKNQKWMRKLFYVLALIQLVSFGIIKIRNDWRIWTVIGTCLFSAFAIVQWALWRDCGDDDLILLEKDGKGNRIRYLRGSSTRLAMLRWRKILKHFHKFLISRFEFLFE
ncbi:hypothetical protein CTEN210_02969 [Chaetoceros tenuissimus]|uniref:Uncharacterized protein n=1 Tax=Chaetoceros tenuissimus TaxID=426638 RepID=A0AAD3CJY1_9STRA|nr:hypothetical protein CTEN210_02966 [Chaetoceros tenuissimus]GFH46495.1 hypothetical protein CTEN210_02969 [Chaetoceros tenuissimus]